MRRFLISIAACALIASPALAQSVPNGPITQGQIWMPSQWNSAWESKQDVLGLISVDSAPYSAKGDCSTDDTAAIEAAIAAAQAITTASGTAPVVQFGKPCYAFNLALSGRGVIIRHGATATNQNVATKFVPYNTGAPVIQIGDGSTQTVGWELDNISLQGSGAGAIGLKIDGASRLYFNNLTAYGFTSEPLDITDSATQPATLIWFNGGEVTQANVAGAVGARVVNVSGGLYTTAIYFDNMHFDNGGVLGSEALHLENDGSQEMLVNANHTYLDCGSAASGVAGCLTVTSASGLIEMNADDTDFDAASNFAIDISAYAPSRQLTDPLHGTYVVAGTIKTADTASPVSQPGGYFLPYNSVMGQPEIMGGLCIQDSTQSWAANVAGAVLNDCITRSGSHYFAYNWWPNANDTYSLGANNFDWVSTYTEHVGGQTAVSFAPGAGAGASANVACASGYVCTDMAGTVSLTTGTGPATGVLFTVTSNVPGHFVHAPSCLVTFDNYPAASVPPLHALEGVGGFSLSSNQTALTSTTTYTIKYVCLGD